MDKQMFEQAYNELEIRMSCFAAMRKEIYVPNIVPLGPVDYIFICMEPSLGEWAKNPDDAKSKLQDGFRNFVDGFNTMILHYAARKFLCKNGQGYHLTDLSKGAMLTEHADNDRILRYRDWYPLLLEEIRLVASKNVRIFAVGRHVSNFLERQKFPWVPTPLIHYSGNAASHWDREISARYDDFRLFQDTVTREDFLENARDVIERSGVPPVISERALERLRGSELTLSRRKLMFNYKLVFDAVHNKERYG